MLTRMTRSLLLIFFLASFSVACSQEEPTPAVPTPEPTQEVAAAPATATTAPTATATQLPPSSTPLPTRTPTATPSPTPTPPLTLSSAEDFGEHRNPLTGEKVEDPSALQRRPIAVKISNSPPDYVRPQSGLGQADLVFEHVTEGPITRFTAIIYSEAPQDMGPIRSGRLIDVELPAMYDAAFAYSGASAGVNYELFNSDFRERILRSSAPGYFRTGADIPFEHTLYGVPETWWEELEDRGLNRAPQFGSYMAFGEKAPEGGQPISHININYRERMIVDWRYDEESGRYLRWADGEEHTDQNTGEQLSAANVVVVFAVHQVDYSICEFAANGQCQAYSTEAQIWGQGPVMVLRDGLLYEGTWQRPDRNDMLTFYDEDGNQIPLQIGNTFFQVVPRHYEDPVTLER